MRKLAIQSAVRTHINTQRWWKLFAVYVPAVCVVFCPVKFSQWGKRRGDIRKARIRRKNKKNVGDDSELSLRAYVVQYTCVFASVKCGGDDVGHVLHL